MKKRYYGLDALRILAMAFVVIVHSISHGGVSQLVDRHTFNWFAVYFTQYACLAAVNCFVLLSSYFLVTARFNVRKVISFALHVLFYSLTIMLIACTTGIVHPTANVIIKSIAPISTSCYWFPTSYVGLLLLSPFLNAGIKAMTKRQMQFCVCCLLTFFSIIPGFALINSVWQIRTGHCLQWFIAIYFIGAYIRLYVYDIKGNVRIPLPKGIFFFLFYLACPLFDVFLRNIVPDAIWLVFHNKTFSYDLLHGDNSIIITLSAIALFMFFLTMDIKNRLLIKFIEKVAPLVFGVYLIHEWPFLREYLWTNIFSPKSYANSFLLFPYILYVVVAIFTVGLAMEYVRSKVFRFIEGSSLFASICAWLSSKKYIALMENDFDISKMNATQHREEKRREVNIDILKIVSMFAVVVLHFFGVSGLLSSLKPLSVNWWLGNFIEYTAFPAVNCYVIISGYFLCTSKFRIKKLVDLCIQVFIYSFVFYIIGSLVNLQLLNPRDLIKAIFPIPTNYLWFATVYLGLYCCVPFLNISIYSISERQFRYLLLTFFIFLSFLPSITLMYDPVGGSKGFSLIWFIFLYYSAAYIRLYTDTDNTKISQFVLLTIFFLATLALVLCKGFVQPYMRDILNTKYRFNLFYGYTSPLVLMQSISIFCFFRNLKVRSYSVQKSVSLVSPLLFGVYLYHNHPAVRDIIWKHIFTPAQYADSPNMIPYLLFAVSSVFIAGLLIDYVRLKINSFINRTSISTAICNRLYLINFISSMESIEPYHVAQTPKNN